MQDVVQVACGECDTPIASSALRCPACGHFPERDRHGGYWLLGLVLAGITVGLGEWIGPPSPSLLVSLTRDMFLFSLLLLVIMKSLQKMQDPARQTFWEVISVYSHRGARMLLLAGLLYLAFNGTPDRPFLLEQITLLQTTDGGPVQKLRHLRTFLLDILTPLALLITIGAQGLRFFDPRVPDTLADRFLD